MFGTLLCLFTLSALSWYFFFFDIVLATWITSFTIGHNLFTFGIGYMSIGLLHFAVLTYNDGKTALIMYRNDNTEKYDPNQEWLAVKFGCRKNLGENLFESFMFPYTIISNLLPSLIMLLNPPPKH